jgi:soluble lytic murein transglycosylase
MKTYLSFLNLFLVISALCGRPAEAARELASVPEAVRIGHARELMGKGYRKSVVAKVEQKRGLEQHVLEEVTRRVPKKWKPKSREIAAAILKESARHELDPLFVMAVISGESSFNPEAVGPVGEIGLMQLRPSTAAWIARKQRVKWQGEKTLTSPTRNIELGVAYLGWLRTHFRQHGQLYLAAYNMGATSVKRALDKKIWPKDYPRHVMKRYLALYRDFNARPADEVASLF